MSEMIIGLTCVKPTEGARSNFRGRHETGTDVILHFLCFTAIVGVIAWGSGDRRDLAGGVAMSMVIALAMLPFLTSGKPWPAWRMYAFVAAFGVAAAATHYFRPSPW